MPKKLPRHWKMALMVVLALWCLSDGPDLVSSKVVANSQQAFRDAKTRQDVDRRAVEFQRQQLLTSAAAKFDEKQGNTPNFNSNYSWNQRSSSNSNRNYSWNQRSSSSYNTNYQRSSYSTNQRYNSANQQSNSASQQYNTAKQQYNSVVRNSASVR